jgi:NhaP-type Na+/H+ or K+/H+ antiporter
MYSEIATGKAGGAGTAFEVVHLLIVCLLAGTLGQVLSGLLRLPSILFLLGLGVALGPDGTGLINPSTLGKGLEVLVRLGVAFILFEGSMALRLREIRKVQRSVRRLITLGVAFTFAAASAAAHFIGRLPLPQACLFGALVTVTGPTVIRPLVQRIRMRPELAAILEGEGILADPVGAILAAVCLEYALAPGATALGQLREFGIRMGVGFGVGVAVGLLAGLIVKYRAPAVERIKPLVVLGCALGCYAIAESVRHESGIMAAVAAGLTIQFGVASHDRELREFRELLTTLILSVLFILLAANLRRERMLAEGLPGLLTVLAVMVVIRPLNVFLCTAGGVPTFREKVFLSWVAPRGIVAASVASLGALVLEREGQPGAHRVESLVFLIIFLTVFLQGGSATLLAGALGITVKEARSVLIVGANPIARLVAAAYLGSGKSVTVVDRNLEYIEEAARLGVRTVPGDGTDREVLHQAGLDDTDLLMGLTGSSTVNQTAAQVALHDRDLHQIWIAVDENKPKKLDEVLARAGAEIAFGRPIPFQVWQHQLENGRARALELEVTEKNVPKRTVGETPFSNDVVPVMLRRGDRVELVRASTLLQPGDRLTVLSRVRNEEFVRYSLGVAPGA